MSTEYTGKQKLKQLQELCTHTYTHTHTYIYAYYTHTHREGYPQHHIEGTNDVAQGFAHLVPVDIPEYPVEINVGEQQLA